MKENRRKQNTLLKLSAWVMLILMLSALLLIHIGAADENPIYTQNKALQGEKYGLLMQLKTKNIATAEGTNVNNYIHTYDEKLNSIDAETLSTTAAASLIELYYVQGCTTNQVAWIYYTYCDLFSGDARKAVDKVHNELQAEIANATDAADLSELSTLSYNNKGLCARMYVAVFEQKLLSLLKSEDSEAVKSIVTGENGAVKAITKCTTVTSSTQYDEIYAKAASDVKIQRNRDKASEELKAVDDILQPNREEQTYISIQSYLDSINSPTTVTVSKMNELVQNSTLSILRFLQNSVGDYGNEYLEGLISKVFHAVAIANEKDEIAAISPLLNSFAVDFARAQAKDALVAYTEDREYKEDADVAALLAEYNRANGIFDQCTTADYVAFELERARLRADLYGEYKKALNTIEGWLGKTQLSTDAFDQYDYAKYRIVRVDRASEGAMNICKNEYQKGVDALAELVVEAEVQSYEPKHKEILGKDLTKITREDKSAITAAIEDMIALSDGAKKIFEEKNTPADLAEKYKAASKQDIDLILGNSTSLRRDNAYALKDAMEDLSIAGKADNLEDLIEKSAGLLLKTVEIDRVLDRYDSLTRTEGYEGFLDSDKDALEKIASDKTKELRAAESSEGVLIGVANDAILMLDRGEAYAILNAAVAEKQDDLNQDTKKAIDTVVADAKEAIGEEQNADNIKKLTDAALFDIMQEYDLQELTEKAQEAIKTIENADVLSAEQKKAHTDKINAYLAEQSERIRKAKSAEEHKNAVTAFHKQLEAYLKAADEENERERTARKSEATAAIREAYAHTSAELDKLSYLSSEELAVLKQAADLALSDGIADIEKAHTPKEIADQRDRTVSTLNWLISEGESQNDEAGEEQRAEANRKIRDRAGEVLTLLNEKQYLSADQKMQLLQDIENAVMEFSGELSMMEGTAQLNAAYERATEAFNDISDRCDAWDLQNAKAAANRELSVYAEETAKEIDHFRFLEKPISEQLKRNNDALLSAGIEKVEDCESIDAIPDATKEAKDALKNHREKAKEAENEACIEALTPYIIAFAAVFAVELVAVAVLCIVYKKKATTLSIAAPVMAAMMPAPLAWMLVILLGLTDIALLAMIIYMIVKLSRLSNVVEEKFDKTAAEAEDDSDSSEEEIEEAEEAEDETDDGETFEYEEADIYETSAVDTTEISRVAENDMASNETAVAVATTKTVVSTSETEKEDAEAASTTPALKEKPKREKLGAGRTRPTLGAGERRIEIPLPKFSDLFAPKAKLPIEPKREMIYLLPEAKPQPMQSVTVEEADRLISDEEAFSYEETDVVNTEVYTGKKKATVNIDRIGKHFEASDIVSLNTLKEKGLISSKVGHVKILGRGMLDKPLTVMAQNFSASAVKMIVLTGGTAILVEGSKEIR